MAQYDFTPAAGFAGQLADQAPRYVRTAKNEEDAALEFGIFVKKGTADDSCKRLAALLDEIAGVTLHQHALDHRNLSDDGADGIAADEEANLLVEGVVMMKTEQGVTPADPVYARFSDGDDDSKVVGAVRKDGDSNTARRVFGARFLASADAGGLVPVQFSALVDAAMHDVLDEIDEEDALS